VVQVQEKLGPVQLTKRLLVWEIIIVFALSLGGSALFAIIDLIASLTANKALNKQQALIVGSLAPGRPLLDLILQLANLLIGLAPVALVCWSGKARRRPPRSASTPANRAATWPRAPSSQP
jgi:hypothetical protein